MHAYQNILRLGILKKHLLFSLLSVFLVFDSFSQELCGQLMDANENSAAYIKVINLRTQKGVYSDRHGNFCVDYITEEDSIVVFSGREYKTLFLKVNEFPNGRISLSKTEQSVNFKLDSYGARKTIYLNDFPNKKDASLILNAEETVSSFIQGSADFTGRIQSISFFLNEYTDDYLIIPVLFEFNITTNSIGKKISLKNFQLDSIQMNNWNELKIKDTIFMPQHGICVGFECVPRNRKINYYDSIKKSTVNFGAYYQKLNDGNRTYFLNSKEYEKWFQIPNSKKNENHVLNLAVKIKLDGKEVILPATPRKFVKQKKVKKAFEKYNQSDLELPQTTIYDLYSSLSYVLETKDLLKLNGLIRIAKKNDSSFEEACEVYDFNKMFSKEQGLKWNLYLQELENSPVTRIENNVYSITFKDKSTHYLIHENDKWFLAEMDAFFSED